MLYAIFARDVEDSLSFRAGSRADHLARIQTLQGQGRLVLAGPLPAVDSPEPGEAGFSGSLIVAEFESLEQARAWAEDDPYFAAGAWASAEVVPFLQAAP
ncbi:MAG: YciI family protein [Xanthomonadales bacterium]|nr:YciI family protein [Xanthomonadales bacterium]